MITIKKPQISIEKNKAILTCKVLIDDEEREIFYEIDKEYKDYLCVERADAFVIAAIYYAMKYHHDISSELPITSSIYHNLTTYLIPALSGYSDKLSKISLKMPLIDVPIATKGEVGTGMSCGIDSLHALKNYLNPECQDMKLTCLCVNNVGSFKAYSEKYRGMGSDKAREAIIKRAEKVSKEVKLPLIVTDSNIHSVFPDTYYRIHTFANMFSIFLLQKFFKIYYYASIGYDLSYYNIKDSYSLDSAEYDLLTCFCLNTETLKIYPEGIEKHRMEKTAEIADFDIAKNNLHVCIKNSENCGKCMKCKRTLVSLDALGKLDNFKNVFDIEYYKNNKEEYYEWLEKEEENGSVYNTKPAKLLRQKHGETIYEDIEEYNQKNIIIPEIDIDSISIKKENFILNKASDEKYQTDLCYRLAICLELANQEDKEIRVPRYLLDNVKVYYKNQKTLKKKWKYIKKIIRKRTRRVNIHELIYFLLYKPSTYKNIIAFLKKEGYLNEIDKEYNPKYSTAKQLANIFSEIYKNKVMQEILGMDSKVIRGKSLKNRRMKLDTEDSYYKNIEYQEKFFKIEKDIYFFAGKIDDYTVAIISTYEGNRKQIFTSLNTAHGLIKKLNE